MLVISFDPGVTTGICYTIPETGTYTTTTSDKAGLDPISLVWGILEQLDYLRVDLDIHKLLIVMEDAVVSGRMNSDKVEQIKVIARIEAVADYLLKVSKENHNDEVKFDVVFRKISPEMRKHIEVKLPEKFKTPHEKDAFLQAIAGAVLEGVTHIKGKEIKDAEFIRTDQQKGRPDEISAEV